jgi:hypothetical protein
LLSFGRERDVLNWNISIILSELRVRSEKAIDILLNALAVSSNPWIKTASAVGLINMKEDHGWQYLSKCFKEKGIGSMIAAFFLAQIPKDTLASLGIEKLNCFENSNPYDAIVNILKTQNYRKDSYFTDYISLIVKDN